MVTIFTPTYNRAEKLQRVYESLIAQTNYDFEWLIVDDGSSDNTESVAKSFNRSLFRIVYEKKNNGGKHTAYNRALELAQGEYFFCVDSDDWLVEGAIEKILNFVRDREARFILSYKQDESGKRLSDSFPENIERISLFELNDEYHCGGEFSIIFRTDFARKFPFPMFEGENFITESVIYDRMTSVEKVSLLSQVVTICEYQEDGLSNNLNSVMKKNPAGYCLYFMQRIDMQDSLKSRIITAGKYNCFCIFAGKNKSAYVGNHKKTVIFCKPIGILFWLYYKLLRGF